MAFMLDRTLLAAFAFVVTASVSLGADPVTVPLQNAGFEIPWPPANPTDPEAKVIGVVAEGWSDNSSWADVQVRYGADTEHPHSGSAAQRVEVEKVASGAVQFVQKVRLEKDKAYGFSVWMRGRPGSVVGMILRKVDPATYYADDEAALSPEWKKYTIEGVVDEDTEAFLMLRVTAPMEFSVDDAQLTDITEATTDREPQEGNLISGGSFEVGMPFGWSTRVPGPARWHFLDVQPTIDESTAAHGSPSYRIDLPSGMEALIRSPIIHPNVQRPHAASLWMKADQPNTHVHVELEHTDVATDASLGTEWQRVELKGDMPFQRWTRLLVRTRAADDETPQEKSLSLWIDAVQLEEAAEPSQEYQPKSPYQMTVRLDRPGSMVFKNQQVRADLNVHPQPPQGAQVRLKAVDVFGTEYELPPVQLPATSIELPPMERRPLGVFKLTAVLENSEGRSLSAPVEMVWSRLPRPREIDPKSSFFGVRSERTPGCLMCWAILFPFVTTP